MVKAIFEIIAEVEAAKTEDEKVKVLQANSSRQLKLVLGHNLDPRIEWSFPQGDPPPYKPCVDEHDTHGRLLHETKMFDYFIKGSYPNMTTKKREGLFISILESIHPKDALIMMKILNKEPLATGLDVACVKKAFANMTKDW
jgi:hypothetical protein